MRKSTVAISSAPGYTLWQLVRSDSAALVGYMRHDLVDARKWISEADYKAGLALSLGLSHQFADDHQMLKHGMVMYDALYA